MKLHLPSSLRKALLACLAAIAAHALPVTVSTGSLAASGALISFLASQQSLATEEDDEDAVAPLAEGTLEWIGGTDVGAGTNWFEGWEDDYLNDGNEDVNFGTEHSNAVLVEQNVNVHDMTVTGEGYSFEGTGTINVGGTLTLNNADVTFDVNTEVQNFSHSGTVQLRLGESNSLTIHGGLGSISGITLVSGGRLILGDGSNSGNTGTINGGTFETTLVLNIASSGAWFIINGGTFNDIQITSGELSITGGTFNGSIDGTENSKLTVEWGGTIGIAQDVTVGSLEMRDNTTLHVTGDFSLLNSGLETAGQSANGSETLQVDGDVSLALNGDATFNGNLVTAEGQTLSLTGSGTQTLSYDTLTLASDISIGSGVTLKLSGLDATLSGDITLENDATLFFASTGGSAERVLVAEGNTATLSVYNFSSGSTPNSIDIGALSVGAGATLKIDPGTQTGGAVVYLNSALSGIEGELQINNAHLTLMQGGTVNGTLVVDWDGTITLGDDLIFAAGATLRAGTNGTNTIVAAEETSAYLLLSTSGDDVSFDTFDTFVTSASELLTDSGNVGVGIYATANTAITDNGTIGKDVKIAGAQNTSVKFEGNMTFSGDVEVASGVTLGFYAASKTNTTIQGELTGEGTLHLGNDSTVTLEQGGSIGALRFDWQRNNAGPTLYLGDTLEVGSISRTLNQGAVKATIAKKEGVTGNVQLIITPSTDVSTKLMTFGEGIVIVKRGNAQQQFTGGLTISGELRIEAGTLRVDDDCSIASVTGTGGTLWLEGGTKTIDSLNFAGTVNTFNGSLNLSLTNGGTVGTLVNAWGATIKLGDDLTIKGAAKNGSRTDGNFAVIEGSTASLVFDTTSASINVADYSWKYGAGLGLGVKGGNMLTMNAGTFTTVEVSGNSTLTLGAADGLSADSLTFSAGNTVALGAHTLTVGSITGAGSITVSQGGHISGLTSLTVEGGQLSITLSGFELENFTGADGYQLFQGGSFQESWWNFINLDLGLDSIAGYKITYEGGAIKLTEVVAPDVLVWATDADGEWTAADNTTDWASEDGETGEFAFVPSADVKFGASGNKSVSVVGSLEVGNMTLGGNYTFAGNGTGSVTVTGDLTIESNAWTILQGGLSLTVEGELHGGTADGTGLRLYNATLTLEQGGTIGELNYANGANGGTNTVRLGGDLTVGYLKGGNGKNYTFNFETLETVDKENENDFITLTINGLYNNAPNSTISFGEGMNVEITLDMGGNFTYISGSMTVAESLTLNTNRADYGVDQGGTLTVGKDLTYGNQTNGQRFVVGGDTNTSTLSVGRNFKAYTLRVDSNGSADITGNATVNTLQIWNSGELTVGGILDVAGNIQNLVGSLTVGGTLSVAGNINYATGLLKAGHLAVTGDAVLGSDALIVTGTGQTSTIGTLKGTNGNTVTLTLGENLTITTLDAGNADHFIFNRYVAPGSSLDALDAITVTISGFDNHFDEGTTRVSQTLAFGEKVNLMLATSGKRYIGTLEVGGNATFTGGDLSLGRANVTVGGDMSILNGNLGINNEGTGDEADVSVGGNMSVSNDMQVNSAASIEVTGDLGLRDISIGSVGGATIHVGGNLTARGSITVNSTNGATITVDKNVSLSNGSVNLTSGRAALTVKGNVTEICNINLTASGASFTVDGSLTMSQSNYTAKIAAGTTLTLGGGASIAGATALNGDLYLNGGTLALTNQLSGTGKLHVAIAKGANLSFASFGADTRIQLGFTKADLTPYLNQDGYQLFAANTWNEAWRDYFDLTSLNTWLQDGYTLSINADGKLVYSREEVGTLYWQGDGTWTAGAEDRDWANSAETTDNTLAFSTGADVVFGASAANKTVTLQGTFSVRDMEVQAGYTFTTAAETGTLEITGALTIGTGVTATFNGNGTVAFGELTGDGTLVIDGGAAVSLVDEASTFGTITLTNGSLSLGADLSVTALTGGSGTLSLGASTLTVANALSISGALSLTGGTLDLSSGGTISGLLNLSNSGTIKLGGDLTLSSSIAGSGSYSIIGTQDGISIVLDGVNDNRKNYTGSLTVGDETHRINLTVQCGGSGDSYIESRKQTLGSLTLYGDLTIGGTGNGGGGLYLDENGTSVIYGSVSSMIRGNLHLATGHQLTIWGHDGEAGFVQNLKFRGSSATLVLGGDFETNSLSYDSANGSYNFNRAEGVTDVVTITINGINDNVKTSTTTFGKGVDVVFGGGIGISNGTLNIAGNATVKGNFDAGVGSGNTSTVTINGNLILGDNGHSLWVGYGTGATSTFTVDGTLYASNEVAAHGSSTLTIGGYATIDGTLNFRNAGSGEAAANIILKSGGSVWTLQFMNQNIGTLTLGGDLDLQSASIAGEGHQINRLEGVTKTVYVAFNTGSDTPDSVVFKNIADLAMAGVTFGEGVELAKKGTNTLYFSDGGTIEKSFRIMEGALHLSAETTFSNKLTIDATGKVVMGDGSMLTVGSLIGGESDATAGSIALGSLRESGGWLNITGEGSTGWIALDLSGITLQAGDYDLFSRAYADIASLVGELNFCFTGYETARWTITYSDGQIHIALVDTVPDEFIWSGTAGTLTWGGDAEDVDWDDIDDDQKWVNDAAVTFSGTSGSEAPVEVTLGADIVTGAMTVNGEGSYSFIGDGHSLTVNTLEVDARSSVTIGEGVAFSFSQATVDGSLTVASTVHTVVGTTISLQGSGSIDFAGLSGSGTVEINDEDLTVTLGSSFDGSISLVSGSMIMAADDATLADLTMGTQTSVTLGGDLTITALTLSSTNGSYVFFAGEDVAETPTLTVNSITALDDVALTFGSGADNKVNVHFTSGNARVDNANTLLVGKQNGGNSSLTVHGDLTVDTYFVIAGSTDSSTDRMDLNVSGDATINGNFRMGYRTSGNVYANAYIGGDAVISGTMTLGANANTRTMLQVGGDLTVQGTGASSVGNAGDSEDFVSSIDVKGDFSVTGAFTMYSRSTVNVGKFATFSSDLTIGANSVLTLEKGGSIDGTLSGAGSIVLNGGTLSIASTQATLGGLTLGGTLQLGKGAGDTANCLSIAAAGFSITPNGKLAIDSTGLDATQALIAFTGGDGYTLSSLLTVDFSLWTGLSQLLTTPTETYTFALFSGLSFGNGGWEDYLRFTGLDAVTGWYAVYNEADGTITFRYAAADSKDLVWKGLDQAPDGGYVWAAEDDADMEWTDAASGTADLAFSGKNDGSYSVTFGDDTAEPDPTQSPSENAIAKASIAVSGAVEVNNMTVVGTHTFTAGSEGASIHVGGDLSISSGNLTLNGVNLALDGALSMDGTGVGMTLSNVDLTLKQGGVLNNLLFTRDSSNAPTTNTITIGANLDISGFRGDNVSTLKFYHLEENPTQNVTVTVKGSGGNVPGCSVYFGKGVDAVFDWVPSGTITGTWEAVDNLTLNGVTVGTGSLIAGKVLTLRSNTTLNNSGTIQSGQDLSVSGNLTASNNGTVTVGRDLSVTGNLSISNGSTVTVERDLTITGNLSTSNGSSNSALLIDVVGTLSVGGTTSIGGYAFNSTLRLRSGGALGTVIMTNGQIELGDNLTIEAFSQTGPAQFVLWEGAKKSSVTVTINGYTLPSPDPTNPDPDAQYKGDDMWYHRVFNTGAGVNLVVNEKIFKTKNATTLRGTATFNQGFSMSGGTLSVDGLLTTTFGNFTGGTITLGAGASMSESFTLGGTLNLDKGVLTVAGELSGTGSVNVRVGHNAILGQFNFAGIAADTSIQLGFTAEDLTPYLNGPGYQLFAAGTWNEDWLGYFDLTTLNTWLQDGYTLTIDADGKLVYSKELDDSKLLVWRNDAAGDHTWKADADDTEDWTLNDVNVTYGTDYNGGDYLVQFGANAEAETITVEGAVSVQNMTVEEEGTYTFNGANGNSISVGADGLTVDGDVTFNVDTTVTGALTGSGSITITGRTLTLNGGNIFEGTLDVKGGTLAVGADMTTATLTNSGSFGNGTLTLSNGAVLTVNNAVDMAGHLDFGANTDGTLKLENGGTIAGRMDLGGTNMAIQIGGNLTIGRGFRNTSVENASLTITALTDGLTLTLGTQSNTATFSQSTKTAVTIGDSTHNIDLLLQPGSGQAFTQKFEGGLTLYGNLTLTDADILLRTAGNVITGTISGAGRTVSLGDGTTGNASLELRGTDASTVGTLYANASTLTLGGDLNLGTLDLGGRVTFNRYAQSANDVVTVTIGAFNGAASRTITFGEGVDGVFTAFTTAEFSGSLTMNGNATFNGEVLIGAANKGGTFVFNARTDEDGEVVNTVAFNENVTVGVANASTVTAADGVDVSLAGGKTLTVQGGSTFTVGGALSAGDATVSLAGATSSVEVKDGGSIGTLSGTAGNLTLSGGTLSIGATKATLTSLTLGGTLQLDKGTDGTNLNQLTLGGLTLAEGATLAIGANGLSTFSATADNALIHFSQQVTLNSALKLDLSAWNDDLNALLTGNGRRVEFALFSGEVADGDFDFSSFANYLNLDSISVAANWEVTFVDGKLVFRNTNIEYSDTITWVGGDAEWSVNDEDEGEWENNEEGVTFADPHTGDTVNVLFSDTASNSISVVGAVGVNNMTVEGDYEFTAGANGSLAVGGNLVVDGSAEFGLGVTLTGALEGSGTLTVASGGSLTMSSSSADFAGTLVLSRTGSDTNNAAIIIDSTGVEVAIGGNMTLTARAAGEADAAQYYIWVKGNNTVAIGDADSTLNMNGENLIFRVENANAGDNYIHSRLTNLGVIKLHTNGNNGPAVNLHLTHAIDGATSGTTLEVHRHNGYSTANLYVDAAVSGLEAIKSSSANIYLTSSLTVNTDLTVNGLVYVQGSLLGEEDITLEGGTLTLGGEDDSDLSGYGGTLNVTGGTLNVQSEYGSGLSITGGTTNVQADVTSTIAQSGGNLNVQSDMSGSIDLSGGTAYVKAGVSGGISVSGGTINLSKADDDDTATHAIGSVNVNVAAAGGSRMNVQSGLWSVGESTYTAGSLHTYVSAGATLIITGDLTTNGELRMSKAADENGGDDIYSQVQLAADTTLTITKLEDSNETGGGGIFSLYNGAEGDTATLKITNTGSASTVRRITTHEGVTLELADGAKQNLAEATLEGDLKLGAGAMMAIQSVGGATGKSTINSTVSGSGTLSVQTEVDFGGSMNGASLALTSGTLNLNHADTTAHNLGSIAITTAGTLNVKSGEWNLAGLSGDAATVNVTGGQLTLGGDLDGIGTLTLDGGKVALGGHSLTVGVLTGGTDAAHGSISLTGYTLGDLGSDALITITGSASGVLTLDLTGFAFNTAGEYTIFDGAGFTGLEDVKLTGYTLAHGYSIGYVNGKIVVATTAEAGKLLTWHTDADAVWSASDQHQDWQDAIGTLTTFDSAGGYTVIFGADGPKAVAVEGDIEVEGMTVSAAYVFSQHTSNDGSISVTGEDGLYITGSATFDGVDVTVTNGLLLDEDGALTVTGASTTTAASLSGTGNVKLDNSAAVLELTNGGSLTGELQVGRGGTLKLGGDFELTGKLVQGDWNNRANYSLNIVKVGNEDEVNFTLDLTAASDMWGSLSIGEGVNWNLTRSDYTNGAANYMLSVGDTGSVSVQGDLSIAAGVTLRFHNTTGTVAGELSGAGTLAQSAGTLTLTSGGEIGALQLGSAYGFNAPTLKLGGDLTVAGALTAYAAGYGTATIQFDDEDLTLSIGSALAYNNNNTAATTLTIKSGADGSGTVKLLEGGVWSSAVAGTTNTLALDGAVTLDIATGKSLSMGQDGVLSLANGAKVTGEVALAGGSVTVSGTGSTMSKLSSTSGALSLAANGALSIADFSGSLTTLTLNEDSVLTLDAAAASVELGTLNMAGNAMLKLTGLTQTSGFIFTDIGQIEGSGVLRIDLQDITLEKGTYKLFSGANDSLVDLAVTLLNAEADGLSVEYKLGYIRVFDPNAGDMLVWSGEDQMLWNEDENNTPWDDNLAFSSGKDVMFRGTSTGQNGIQVFVGSPPEDNLPGQGMDIVAGSIVVDGGTYDFVNLNGDYVPFTITADSLTLNDATVSMTSNLTVNGSLSGSGELTEFGKLWLKSGGSFSGKILFDMSGAGNSSMQIDGDLTVSGLGFGVGGQNSVQITMGANLTIANTTEGFDAGSYEFVKSGEEPVQVVLQTDGDWGIGPVRAGGAAQVNATLTFGEGVSLKKTGSGKLTFDGYGTLGTSIEIAEGTLSLNGTNSVSGTITGAGDLQVVTGTTDNKLTLNGSVDIEGSMILSHYGAQIDLGDGVDVTVGSLKDDSNDQLQTGRNRTITGLGEGTLFTINTAEADEALVSDLVFSDNITVMMKGEGTQTLRDTQVRGALEVHNGMLQLAGETTVGDLRLTGDHLTVAQGGKLTATSLSLTGATTINLTLSDGDGGTTLDIGTFAANDGTLTLNLTLADFDNSTYKTAGYQLFINDFDEGEWKTWTGSLKFTTDADGVRVRVGQEGQEGWIYFDDLSSTWVWDGTGEWSDGDSNQWTANNGSPRAQDLVFSDVDSNNGSDDVQVSQEGVHANSVTVESGDYTFSGGTITAEGSSPEHNWKVGGTGNEAHATLDTDTEGFAHFEVAENGTLELTENADLDDGKIIFTGGSVVDNGSIADLSTLFDELDHDGVNHHTDAVKVKLGEDVETEWRDGNGVAVTLTQGLEKDGEGKLTVDWSDQDATQTYAGITVKDGEVVLTATGKDDDTLKLEGGLHGAGDVTLSGDGSYELSGTDSDLEGTLTLEADVTVAGDSTLGGENATLALSGGNITATNAATVAAGTVKVHEDTTLTGTIELKGDLQDGDNNGTLTATEGADITLSGDASGYTADYITGDDAKITLVGALREVSNTLSGTGTVAFDSDVPAVQLFAARPAANETSTLLTSLVTEAVNVENAGTADVIIANDANDSTGAIVVNDSGNILLGDLTHEAKWSGTTVEGTGTGSFVLQNGSLANAITTVNGNATLNANVLAGQTVDAAETNLNLFTEVTVAAAGQLQNVTGNVSISDGVVEAPSFNLMLDTSNIGEGAAAQRGVITGNADITISNVNQEETKKKFLVNLSNGGLVGSLKAGLRSGEVWLTILQGGTLTIDDTLKNSSFWYYGDTLRLLSYIGAKLTDTDGGSMILDAQHLDVWFVTDDATITSPNEVNDYGELSGSKATVVDEGQSLTVTVDGAETGDNDTKGELQMNNLIGLEDSELNLNNSAADTDNDRLNVVFDNSMKVTPDDIEHPENFPTDADGNSVLGMDTVFEGTIHGGDGVDVEKRGQGTLTVGSSDGSKGGLLLDDGNVTLSEGGLVLQGKENKMDSFTFNYDTDDEDNNSGLTLKNGTTTIGEIVEDGDEAANNGVHIEQGAQLVLTGDSELNDTTLSSSDGSGSLSVKGSLSTAADLDNLATDVSGNLTLTGDATMSNTELTVDKNGTVTLNDNSTMTGGTAKVDGTLDLGSGSHDVGSLSGSGTLKANNGSLELTGKGNEFNGTFAGKGTLDVAAGADLTLSGITTASSTNDAWNLQNSGSLTIDVSGEDAEDVYFDSITTGKGADLTYRFNSDAKDGARLHAGDMDFASDSQFVIESTGAAGVKVGEDGRYVLGQVGSLTGLKQDNVEVKGMAFLHYDPSHVGVDENGNLYVQLAESKVNKFRANGMEKNSLAGADMFWNASNPNSANWQRITGDFLYALFYSDLYRTVNELYNLKSQGKEAEMAKALAAGAGASTSVLGAALSQDIKRQLGAIRNRTTTMGNEPKYDTYDEAPFYHMWINGEGSVHKMDASGMAPGYSLNSWGGTVGVDLDLSATTTVGFALTAMYGDLKADAADSARGDMDTTYVTAFARVADGAWIHTFVVAGGRADVSFNRTVTVGEHAYSTKGSTDGYTLGALYELGYTAVMNAEGTFALQSVFNVEFRHAALSGYTETGSDAGLKVGDISHNVLTFGAGVRAQAVVGENAYNRTSILEGRMLVKADAGDRSGTVSNSLINGDGTSRELESAKVGMIGLEIGAGLSIPLGSDSGTIFIDASLEVRSGYTGMDANIGYRINF